MINVASIENNSTPTSDSSSPYVEDALAYFRETLPKHSTYRMKIHSINGESSFAVFDSASDRPMWFRTSKASINALVAFVRNSKEELESKYGLKIDNWIEKGTDGRIITIKKKTRKPSAALIEQGVSPTVYQFIEDAYKANVNLLITGGDGSGKTSFLNTLVDSSKDYTPTAVHAYVREMVFGNDHKEITEIYGDNEDLLQQIIRMDFPRIVIDDFYGDEEEMIPVNNASKSGMQFIATGSARPVSNAKPNENSTDPITGDVTEHPFEIRIDLALRKVDGKYRMVIVGVHELIINKGSTTLRTLFSGNDFVQDPTRAIRRKLEGKTRISKSSGRLRESVKGVPSSTALFAISDTQKQGLFTHRDELSSLLHASNAYEALNHFNVIDEFLNRFK